MFFVRLIRMAEKAFWLSFETTDVIVFADHIIQRTRNSHQKGKPSTVRLLLQISFIWMILVLKLLYFLYIRLGKLKLMGVFNPGKLFQPSLMFVGKARAYSSEAPFRYSTLG